MVVTPTMKLRSQLIYQFRLVLDGIAREMRTPKSEDDLKYQGKLVSSAYEMFNKAIKGDWSREFFEYADRLEESVLNLARTITPSVVIRSESDEGSCGMQGTPPTL
jgi:hypothetical protein